MAFPRRLLVLAVLPLAAACSASETIVASTPTTTGSASAPAPRATGQSTGDHDVFALIRASDGVTVTWDQIDFNSDACATVQSEAFTYKQFFETCYSNANPTLRTAPLDPLARVIVRPRNDPERTVGSAQLPTEITDNAANDVPRQYRAWKLRISEGRVVTVEQAVGASR